jgi:hypothetical protein
MEVISDAKNTKQIIKNQIIESMFSVLEFYLENIYYDVLNSNTNLLKDIMKQISYKEIIEEGNDIIKYILEKKSFSYKPVLKKHQTIEKLLKIDTCSFFNRKREMISEMNELRQEIVHGEGNVKNRDLDKYFSLVYDTILYYDKKVIEYKERCS